MTRFVSFKNVTYNLNPNKLTIQPIPFYEKIEEKNLVKMGVEKYLITCEGDFHTENISADTMQNLNDFLSNYIEALERLT
jgi:hypothetical protein